MHVKTVCGADRSIADLRGRGCPLPATTRDDIALVLFDEETPVAAVVSTGKNCWQLGTLPSGFPGIQILLDAWSKQTGGL